jgi:uncharacterized protein YdhG (YjbR/CyaY superfamily)
MDSQQNHYSTVDEYIALFPVDVQKKLNEVRATIKAAAPEAEEKISYQMAAFTLKGILVYYAAYKHHIGFYPTASGIEHFKSEITDYATSKGTVQFPLDKPLPLELVRRIVTYRVQENLAKAEARRKSKRPE